MIERLIDTELDAEWEDPLAVKVGLQVGADDIPAEGWPDTFKPEVIGRILSYFSEDE